MIKNLSKIECITLFVEDLAEARKFYVDTIELGIVFEDSESTVVKFENIMINLLKISASSELIEPAKTGSRQSGSRLMFTILVSNVDSVVQELKSKNAHVLNGPINRPWGRRTAAFQDPFSNIWEIAQVL